MRIIFFLFLVFLLIPSIISYQNKTACTGNNFFDTTFLNCEPCGTNQIGVNEFTCKCGAGGIKSDKNQIGTQGTCIACPTGQAPSSNGLICVNCPSGVNPLTGDCSCSEREAVIDIDQSGKQLTTKICVGCDIDGYPGPLTNVSIQACKKCPYGMTYNEKNIPWTCECDSALGFTKAGDICVLTTDIKTILNNDVNSIADLSLILNDGTTVTINSDTINFFHVKSAIGCIKYQNDESCQAFANLCVLHLYNERSKLCQQYMAYKNANGIKASDAYGSQFFGWYKNYPWLYYEKVGYQVSRDESFTETVSFDQKSKFHFLEFWAFSYTIDGKYRGAQLLETQLLLCPHSINDGLTFRSIGVSYDNSCNLNLNSIFDRTNNEMLFYEIFLKDRNTGNYIPVPVLLKDYTDSTLRNPNVGDSGYYKYVRRFFLFDNLGTIETSNGYSKGVNPNILRYAKQISLKVMLQDNKDQKIYVPIIEIDYAAKRFTQDVSSFEKVSFGTFYEFITVQFFYTVEILFILTNVAIGFIWLLRMHIWIKFNPSRISPENYTFWVLIKSIFVLIDTWGYVIFLFLFCISAYWFIFFKLQAQVFIFMPPLYETTKYYPFIVIFATLCSFRIFSYLDLIYRQGKIDLFFIDWETPKTLMRKKEQIEEEEIVSVWRTLFIANEFNELQPYRYVSVEWTLFFLGFFLKGVNWENLAATQPFMSLDSENIQVNFVLKWFISSFVFLVIGLIQIIGRRVLNIWIPTSIQDFVDLCSVANISIFVLDETLHGYYIHGKTPGGTAEINAEELEKALEDESKGNSRSRGLESDNNANNFRGALQSYEVFIPWEMRTEYNGNYQVHLEMEVNNKNSLRRNANALGVMIPKALPPGFNFKYIEDKKKNLSKLLKMYIENVYVEKEKYIQDKTPFQRLFSYPPVNMDTLKGTPIFLRDPDLGFQKIFFCGNEFSILITDICIYEMWDLIFKNTLVSILLTYMSIKALVYLRNWFGERNISKKTLINEKFLI